ncbi:hypothetical protein ACWFRF_20730 [Nocardia sp. NPDC055165]
MSERLTDEQLLELVDTGDYGLADPRALVVELLELRQVEVKVCAHIDQRPEYITACTNAGPDSAHDYYRWQGGAEARRQLAQQLGWTVPHKPGEKTTPKETDRD